jgi:tRNA-2-methylthio-N6-dimethylallyladenosine synthase
LMRRTYTNESFRDLVTEMRETMPGLGLTTDVIVGFPTETDDEYRDTRQLMEDIRFDSAFIFKYSERKGTYAQRKLADDVSSVAKTGRIVELIDLQQTITNEINASLVGTDHLVLTEEFVDGDPTRLIGRTDNFKTTVIPADGVQPGDVVGVTIVEVRGATLYGGPVRRVANAT